MKLLVYPDTDIVESELKYSVLDLKNSSDDEIHHKSKIVDLHSEIYLIDDLRPTSGDF